MLANNLLQTSFTISVIWMKEFHYMVKHAVHYRQNCSTRYRECYNSNIYFEKVKKKKREREQETYTHTCVRMNYYFDVQILKIW